MVMPLATWSIEFYMVCPVLLLLMLSLSVTPDMYVNSRHLTCLELLCGP